jgi:hypothetical protein
MSTPEVITRAIADVETLRIELGDRALEHMVVVVPTEAHPGDKAAG